MREFDYGISVDGGRVYAGARLEQTPAGPRAVLRFGAANPDATEFEADFIRLLQGLEPSPTATAVMGLLGSSGHRTVIYPVDPAVLQDARTGGIDAGVGDSTGQRAAMTVADLVLLPVRPGAYDVWTFDALSTLIEEMRSVNPALRAVSFLNQSDHQGRDNKEVLDLLRDFEQVEISELQLGYRKAFRNTACGMSVTELSPADPKAVSEMLSLYNFAFTQSSS